MDQGKFITGIFSVYDSSQARDFKDSERYPIGFEAIFLNDETGKEFAANLLDAMHRLPPERGVLYHLEGEPTDTARHTDCFFRDADTLRRVLNEALHGIGIFHEERGVLPKFLLIEEARELTIEPMLHH